MQQSIEQSVIYEKVAKRNQTKYMVAIKRMADTAQECGE